MKRIYMDNAATTRVTEPVVQAMLPYLTDIYGNPSSVHAFAREARKGLRRSVTPGEKNGLPRPVCSLALQ